MLRHLLSILAVVAGSTTAGAAGEPEPPHAFLELFTSQGCSSCPAADAFVEELAARGDVVAVTMPVKLWDFLGWADTLATDDLTKRQITYSVARGDRDVFTPQMMANGEVSLLGSDRDGVLEWIRQQHEPFAVEIGLATSGGVLTITMPKASIAEHKATLWLLVVEQQVHVPVAEGENRGRRLTYFNVVREMRPIGVWKGEAMAFDLPLADIEKVEGTKSIVIAQIETFKGPGRIIGASQLTDVLGARTVDAAAQ